MTFCWPGRRRENVTTTWRRCRSVRRDAQISRVCRQATKRSISVPRDAADQHQSDAASIEAMSYWDIQRLAKAKGVRAVGKRGELIERVTAPSFSDLVWAPVNDRYNHAVLPRNAPVPASGDGTAGPPRTGSRTKNSSPGTTSSTGPRVPIVSKRAP